MRKLSFSYKWTVYSMFSILHRDNLASHPDNKRAVGGSVASISIVQTQMKV